MSTQRCGAGCCRRIGHRVRICSAVHWYTSLCTSGCLMNAMELAGSDKIQLPLQLRWCTDLRSARRADLRSAPHAADLDAITLPSRQCCPLCVDTGTPLSRAYNLSLLTWEQRVTAGSGELRTGTLVRLAPGLATTQWWCRVKRPSTSDSSLTLR